MRRLVIVALALVIAVSACRSRSSSEPGKERSDCRPDKTCDPGLLCLSNLCVRPPPADCAAVAEQLASFDLGNYAEPSARSPVVARYRAECERAYVTKEQAACLDKVRDKWSAAQCAPALFPDLAQTAGGDCGLLAQKMKAMLDQQNRAARNPQMQRYLDATVRVIRQSCEEDRWPDALKRCAIAADLSRDPMGMATCNQHMPPALQQKIQERLSKAMQDAMR